MEFQAFHLFCVPCCRFGPHDVTCVNIIIYRCSEWAHDDHAIIGRAYFSLCSQGRTVGRVASGRCSILQRSRWLHGSGRTVARGSHVFPERARSLDLRGLYARVLVSWALEKREKDLDLVQLNKSLDWQNLTVLIKCIF